jgi:hypothetical protein
MQKLIWSMLDLMRSLIGSGRTAPVQRPSELVNQISDAIQQGREAEVRDLFKQHPELIRSNEPYFTWLSIAVREDAIEKAGGFDMVRALIEIGCDVNARNRTLKGCPLGTVVDRGDVELTRLLLENGANVNAKPNRDRLVIGAVGPDTDTHSVELLTLLDQYGADIHQCFPFGETDEQINALSMAMASGNDAAVEYLRSRGARLPTEVGSDDTGQPQTLDSEIIAYFSEHFGSVSRLSLREIVPTVPQIAVHAVLPSDTRTHTTLFTTGMSSHAMKVPPGGDPAYRFGELFIQLPGKWPLALSDLESPQYGWPILWLRRIAQYPVQNNTWLGGPFAIWANGEPPEPLAAGLDFTCLLLFAEQRFQSQNGTTIQLYRLTPLYSDERQFEMDHGMSTLMRRFDECSMPFIFDPKRPSCASPRSS